MAEVTLVLQPDEANSKDAYVDRLAPGSNFNNTTLRARREGGNWRFRAFLEFDVLGPGNVPAGAGIVSAVLTITGSAAGSGDPRSVELYFVTSPWDESVTSGSQPGIGDLLGTTGPWPGIGGTRSLDVRDIVQQWALGVVVNNGFSLRIENEGSAPNAGHVYSSSADVTAAWHPMLTIVYEPPPTPPTPSPIQTVEAEAGSIVYITPDGREYPLVTPHDPGRWVLSWSGLGTPPIEYITQRGPLQHGNTIKDRSLRPRVVQLALRQNFCDREAWWQGREDLLNEIRPNRQATPDGVVPGTLRFVQTDGTLRDLDVFITEGPIFEPRVSGRWDEFSFQEVLRFVAHDPTLYDPATVTFTFEVIAAGAQLVFPITFPISFRSGSVDESGNATYPGTWHAFPVITVVGPIRDMRLDNVTTGEKIELSALIEAGRTVTIDLAQGAKTMIDDLGANRIGLITNDSDLGTWHLAPDPEAALGVNALRLRGGGITPATAVSLVWNVRYFGE